MKKSNSIDLHGRYYDDVDLSLEKHFYDNEPPFKIIIKDERKSFELLGQ